jgi:plastocyanin
MLVSGQSLEGVGVSQSRRRRRCQLIAAAFALAATAAAKAEETLLPVARAGPAEIKIVSTEFNYSPAKVWVAAGRKVTLILDNSKAETEHGIIIPAFNFRLTAAAGEIVRKTAVFDQPGEYEFSCDLPGHSEAGMKGKLIVERFKRGANDASIP